MLRAREGGKARDAGTHEAQLATLFQQVERVLQPRDGGVERGLAPEVQLAQELQRVPKMLARCFLRRIPLVATAALQCAAPVGSPTPIHYVPPLDRHGADGLPARERPAVDTVSAVREEAGGRQGAHGGMNVALLASVRPRPPSTRNPRRRQLPR